VLALPWKTNIRRADKSNIIDLYVSGLFATPPAGNDLQITAGGYQWDEYFTERVEPFTSEERRQWLSTLNEVAVSSDAFFPFRDNIDAARQYGAKYVASPGGSTRDDDIIAACDEHDMVLVHTGLRLFHH